MTFDPEVLLGPENAGLIRDAQSLGAPVQNWPKVYPKADTSLASYADRPFQGETAEEAWCRSKLGHLIETGWGWIHASRLVPGAFFVSESCGPGVVVSAKNVRLLIDRARPTLGRRRFGLLDGAVTGFETEGKCTPFVKLGVLFGSAGPKEFHERVLSPTCVYADVALLLGLLGDGFCAAQVKTNERNQ